MACREGACVYDTNPVCECVGGIDLGLLVTHNLLTCGDYVGVSASGGSSDLQGRLAVAGDVTLRGFSVAALAPGPLALTVGGTWHLSDGTVHGDATYGVGADHQRVDFRGAVARGMPLDFAVECDDARKASTQVAALAANGTTTVMPWGVELTGGDARHNIFDLPIAALRPSMTFTVRTPSGASVIINVRGAGEATLSDFQIQFAVAGEGVPPGPRDVLWNFPEATRITITRFGVKGSLLAPRAAVAFDNAHIDGSMVARTVSGNGEYHHLLFRHTPPCPSRPR